MEEKKRCMEGGQGHGKPVLDAGIWQSVLWLAVSDVPLAVGGIWRALKRKNEDIPIQLLRHGADRDRQYSGFGSWTASYPAPGGRGDPFLRYLFLCALEKTGRIPICEKQCCFKEKESAKIIAKNRSFWKGNIFFCKAELFQYKTQGAGRTMDIPKENESMDSELRYA